MIYELFEPLVERLEVLASNALEAADQDVTPQNYAAAASIYAQIAQLRLAQAFLEHFMIHVGNAGDLVGIVNQISVGLDRRG